MADMPERGKLVRDHIPTILRRAGGDPEVIRLSQTELRRALLQKLVEEATDLAKANGRSHMMEELADVKEVFDAILAEYHLNLGDIEFVQKRKRQERGGFARGQFLLEQ